jgi:hypothetical protein
MLTENTPVHPADSAVFGEYFRALSFLYASGWRGIGYSLPAGTALPVRPAQTDEYLERCATTLQYEE